MAGPPPVEYPSGRAMVSPTRAPGGPATGVARVGPPKPPEMPPPGAGGRHAARGGPLSVRGRLLAIIFSVLLVLVGSGVVGGSMFLDSVQLTTQLDFPETTQVLYANGGVLARLGETTRYELPYERIAEPVKRAVVASEDLTFWSNEGVDVGGVVRAAWNNVSGGDTQGGSTITQQYARLAFDLKGVTYQRKVKEAILAWKMSDAMSKEEILAAYLNAVPFGRQAYGVEAAARAFFGKTADNTAPPEQQLTMAESMVLVAMVKQPYPSPVDPEGSPGYDPTVSEAAAINAKARFEYIRAQLVALGPEHGMSAEEAAALVFPETVRPQTVEGNGMEGPGGHIVRQVLSELTHTPGSPFFGHKDWKSLMEGGYQIHTTIDPGAQAAAQNAASRGGSIMGGQPENLQAALVAVQPGTGRVLAYYGGDDGTGSDYAGVYLDQNDDLLGFGYHPPGSSMKVYTLAAALKADFSLRSYWRWNPYTMPDGRDDIRNASTCGNMNAGDDRPCSLLQSTISSLNVPFYQVTLSVGPAGVLTMARDAGIDTMWNDAGEPIDLAAQTDMASVVPAQFDAHLGIGQYGVTVMDHANGLATVAAAGLRADAHFVTKVTKGDAILYGETLPDPAQARILTPQQVNDLTFALSEVESANVDIGWDTAGKTGTWEYALQPGENAHAWMVGFSRRIAAAVWVGNRGEEQPLRDADGDRMYGSGVPASVWRQFMAEATAAMNEQQVNASFNPPNYVGSTMPPGAVPGPRSGRGNGGGGSGGGGGGGGGGDGIELPGPIILPPPRDGNDD
jgi:membrane peptidoglycan carboxypeptidase